MHVLRHPIVRRIIRFTWSENVSRISDMRFPCLSLSSFDSTSSRALRRSSWLRLIFFYSTFHVIWQFDEIATDQTVKISNIVKVLTLYLWYHGCREFAILEPNSSAGLAWELRCWVEGRREKGREFDFFKTLLSNYLSVGKSPQLVKQGNPTLRRQKVSQNPYLLGNGDNHIPVICPTNLSLA